MDLRPRGRLVGETKTIDANAYTTGWSYDDLDRVRIMTYPGGQQVTTDYNTQGLPSTMAYVSGSSYNAAGELTGLTLGNGLATTYTYDSKNLRLTGLVTTNVVQNLGYRYDSVGNVQAITDTLRSEVTTYTYDHLDRVRMRRRRGD